MHHKFRLLVFVINLSFVISSIDEDIVSRTETTICSSRILDRLDLDTILKNDRLVTSYLKCFMDEGPCSGEGRSAKKAIPEIMRTQCKNCSPALTKVVRKIMKYMFENRPSDVERFFGKYDPHDMYYDDLVNFMNETPKNETS